MRTRRNLLLAGATSTIAVLALASAAPAMAATNVVVTDRETVQVYMTPTGEVKVARVYDQVTVAGKGTVDLANPVSTDGLRNLDGLGGPTVEDGEVITKVSVDGEKRSRTVSNFDESKLPVTVKPTYRLDGKKYDNPEDLVGKSGKLDVRYRIENVTSKPATVTVEDGKGNPVKIVTTVPMPLVGSLTTQLPRGFYSVASDQATVTGDGRGGTRLTFTMTLLPPIGSTTAEIGYTAQVTDAVIPRATVSIAVVQPFKNPSLNTAAESYKGGAVTGATLTAGAEEIDANLLKLRDGAADLISGLILLRDGAAELNDGLANEAAPGANQLADGAGQVAAGADELNAGLGRADTGGAELAAGLTKLAAGTDDLSTAFNNPKGGKDLVGGSQDLASGLGLISGGLAQLAGVEGLPQAAASALVLRDGVDKILAGLGSASQPTTILGGLALLSGGNAQLQAGVTQLQTGANQLASNTVGLPVAKGGVDQVRQGLIDAGAPTTAALTGIGTAIAAAKATTGCLGDVACQTALTSAQTTLAALGTSLATGSALAIGGLGQVSTGLQGAINGVGVGATPAPTTLRGGLAQVAGGLAQSATGLVKVTDGVNQVKLGLSNPNCNTANPTNPANPCGLRQGLTLLSDGLFTAVTGVTALSTGAKTAAAGSGDLADGIAQAGDGAQQINEGTNQASEGADELSSGLDQAEAGSAELADGADQVATGAGDLAQGLNTAADGSAKIAAGLAQAAEGGRALPKGADRLSKEGTKKLIVAGNDTTLDFGERYAVLKLMSDNTKDGGLPFGAPEGAVGSAGFSYELAAATHESSHNLSRGVLAIIALAGGAALATFVRARWV